MLRCIALHLLINQACPPDTRLPVGMYMPVCANMLQLSYLAQY